MHETRDAKYGPLTYAKGSGDSIILPKDWIAANIVTCDLAAFGKGRCNKAAKPVFEGFFKALSASPLLAITDEVSMFDQRMMRGSTGSYPSAHAYGLAFDLRDAITKKYTPRGESWPEALPIRKLALTFGITNGAGWKFSDPAHYEYPHA